jgi:hypothetical protein
MREEERTSYPPARVLVCTHLTGQSRCTTGLLVPVVSRIVLSERAADGFDRSAVDAGIRRPGDWYRSASDSSGAAPGKLSRWVQARHRSDVRVGGCSRHRHISPGDAGHGAAVRSPFPPQGRAKQGRTHRIALLVRQVGTSTSSTTPFVTDHRDSHSGADAGYRGLRLGWMTPRRPAASSPVIHSPCERRWRLGKTRRLRTVTSAVHIRARRLPSGNQERIITARTDRPWT